MNKKVLDYIETCESWKVAIKNLHWSANNLSQHELCDDIASLISDFEDLVSEVEQSINGKIKLNGFTPKKYEIKSLKTFVEDVISRTKSFLGELEDMGENYVGIKSECETFIGDMQRKLYLVNFTLKEELKERLRTSINESMPKNLANHDTVDKFIGRRPKSVKARINQIYRIVKKYGIDSKVYSDENWQAISDYYRAISSLGCEVNMKPCGHLNNADSMESDGGYCDYAEDGMPRSKQYAISITFEDGMKISGYIKCMAAGTVSDPFSRYDTCIVLWPKSNRVIENKENMKKQIKLTESELRQIVKEAATKILNETPLNYDIDNFSGKWTKDEPSDEEMALADSAANGDYLDDPFNAPNSWDDDEWIDGDKGIENDYSWGLHDSQPIAQSADNPYAKIGKGGINHDIDHAISMRDRNNNWSEKELHNRDRAMDKFVHGKYDGEDVGDTWDDIHYESKKPMKVTESELKSIVKEAAMKLIKEYGNTPKGAYTVGKLAARQTFRDGDSHQGARTLQTSHYENSDDKKAKQLYKAQERGYEDGKKEFKNEEIEIKPENRGKFNATKKATGKSTEELTHSKNPLTRKRAVFAQNAKKWAKK